MSKKNSITVWIDGKSANLSGFESEEYLQQVASYLNKKISDIRQLDSYRRLSRETRSLLLPLNIADDYFKTKKQAADYDEELQDKEQDLFLLKQRIMDLEAELESLKAKKEP